MTTSLAIVPTPQGAEQDSASTQDNIDPRFLKKEALDLYIANTADTFAYEMQLLRKYNGVYYLYNGTVYQPLDEASFYHMAYHYALSENIRLKPSDCSQLLESVKIRTAESYISPDREDYTVFKNCLVSNSNGVPIQVNPFDYFATIYVDANYLMDANLSHPTADAFLATISGNDPELITRHWEFWGYVLSSDYHAKAIFSLFGPTGNNGKSTELSLLSAFLPGAVDSMAIKYMTSRFGRHRLQHRRFEYSADEGAVNLDSESIGFLKSASGGDNMTADVKCKEMVSFTCKCKIAIASNYNIGMAYTAVDQAFVRRLVTLPYPYSIPKECQDPFIKQKLLMEKDAIATEAFRHYLRLKANNYRFTGHERFDQIQSIQCSPATAEYDAIRDFSQKYCDFTDSSAFVTTQELYAAFAANYPTIFQDITGFSQAFALANQGRISEKRKHTSTYNLRGYTGVKLVIA